MYDRDKKIAGMAHIVLPGKESAVSRENPYKFADEGVKELIREMERAGASRKRITAKIAGGAKMFETASRQWEIGEQNVAAVKLALEKEGIRLVAENTMPNTIILFRMASTYCFCPSVFGLIGLPLTVWQIRSPSISKSASLLLSMLISIA